MRAGSETKVIDVMGMREKVKPSLGSSQVNARGTMTLVAARFQDTFTAARVFQGGCKSGDFNDWLAEELCPRLTSNHVLILDNASLHKTPRTRELIESSGASLMFLPPYSPDYNPIEHDFANIKRHREYHPERTLHDIIQMYK